MERLKIFNGKLISNDEIIEDGCIVAEDGKIVYSGKGEARVEDSIEINAEGNFISPGFVDLHCHGGGGHDFMDGTPEAFLGALKMHASHGTTAMLVTTMTSTLEELQSTLGCIKEAKAKNSAGSQILGLHLEGPYFSIEQRGAQDPKYIKNPDPEEYRKIIEMTDEIVRWSAAPELEGINAFGDFLKSRGILGSVAHSNAVYEQVLEAFEHGFTHVTHLYSGMSGVRRINLYRYAGVIESAYLIDDMTVEIIADGSHLPASLLQLVYKIKGPDKIALITDSMRAAGMPEGESILGSLKKGQRVFVEDGVAKTTDRQSFAGSVATADRLVRTMRGQAGISLTDTIKMITKTPAKIIGADNKGSLEIGKDADIVIFDEQINIKKTIIKGNVVFTHGDGPHG